jgi:hypothetical protein
MHERHDEIAREPLSTVSIQGKEEIPLLPSWDEPYGTIPTNILYFSLYRSNIILLKMEFAKKMAKATPA